MTSTNAAAIPIEDLCRVLFDQARRGIALLDAWTAHFLAINPYLLELCGWTADEQAGRAISDAPLFRVLEGIDRLPELVAQAGSALYDNLLIEPRSRPPIVAEIRFTGVRVQERNYILVELLDKSEERQRELRRRQAHTLAAVGRMAGWIAADLKSVPDGTQGGRAQILRSELSLIAGNGALEPGAVRLNDEVRRMEPELRTILGPAWGVRIDQGAVESVWVDATQLRSAAGKLASYLHRTVTGPAVLVMETRPAREGARLTFHCDTAAAPQIDFSHLFEPFSEPRLEGENYRGLGLAAVCAFVKQSAGQITVWRDQSGAHLEWTLPHPPQAATMPAALAVETADREAQARSLIVLDPDDDLRTMIGNFLARKGYSILEARNEEEARALQLVSGSLAVVTGEPSLLPGAVVMPKPFRLDTLLQKLREALP